MTARIGWRVIARYLAGECSPDEAATVEAWANADPTHAEILRSAERTWDSAEPDAARFDPDRAWRSLSVRIAAAEGVASGPRMVARARWVGPTRWAVGLIAAAIAVVLLLPVVRERRGGPSKVFATSATGVSTVQLDDGSIVRLAPNTELRVNARAKREAWLNGRAFFAVAKQNGEPFVVHTAAGDARVLGTRFELSSAKNAVRLVVFEGRVALTATGGSQVVEAGEVSSAQVGTTPTAPLAADVKRLAPWMDGVLIFQATPLSTVAFEIARQFGTRVVVTDDALAKRTISAAFEHQPFESVIAAICRVADATCVIQDSAVLIRP